MKCALIRFVLVCAIAAGAPAAAPPAPFGAVPSARQLQWHQTEVYATIYLSTITGTAKESGDGSEPATAFNPSALNVNLLVRTLREVGMGGVVLVAKHHGGFCLWPSAYDDYSVKASPWKDGKGDLVEEFADACREAGMKFGVALSAWDRHHKDFGRPEYVATYRKQLNELLTNYGEIFLVGIDGSSGGPGCYGGARDTRTVDPRTYYGWDETFKMIRDVQPNAVIASDAGPDVRTIGHERGFVSDPCWATVHNTGWLPGLAPADELAHGQAGGSAWMPAAAAVPLRSGWFYHAGQDAHVKTAEQLVGVLFNCVGHAAALNLGLALDPQGRLPQPDAKTLFGMRRILDQTFRENLARTAVATASNTRGSAPQFGPRRATSGEPGSYWATDDGTTKAWLELNLGEVEEFNVVSLREYLPLGQRIAAYRLEIWDNDNWKTVRSGTTIGAHRLERVVPTVKSQRVRLVIEKALAAPTISDFSVHREPRAD